MERKIPYSLLGKPTLFNAWVHLRDNPDMRPSDVGRMFGTRASDGTRILKELRKIKPTLRGALILPGGPEGNCHRGHQGVELPKQHDMSVRCPYAYNLGRGL